MAENQPLKNRVNTTSFPEIYAPLRAVSDQEFEERALRLFAFQYERNRAYQMFCDAQRRTPETVRSWQEIPAVPTAAFKEFELSCIPPEDRTAVFYSSGTTEQTRSRHFHNAESLGIYEESLLIGFEQNVVSAGAVSILSLTPEGKEAPNSSLVYMFDCVGRKLGGQGAKHPANETKSGGMRRTPNAARDSSAAAGGEAFGVRGIPALSTGAADHKFGSPQPGGRIIFTGSVNETGDWVLDFERTMAELHRMCRQTQPACILGTAFLFVHLLDYLRERELRFRLPAGSVIMETGGYKGRSRTIARGELHEMICDAFGVRREQIVCEYGMSELSSQAYGKVTDTTCGDQPSKELNGLAEAPSPNKSRSKWTPHPGPLPFERGEEALSPDPNAHLIACGEPDIAAAEAEVRLPTSRAPGTEQRRVFHFPGWCRVQMVSPENGREVAEGETGLIRVFDLANVYSVMAVQTEDLGIKRGGGFELIGRAALSEPRGCSLMAGAT